MPSEPLPDFDAVDVTLLATGTPHPRLAAIAAELLAWWPTADVAVAAYNDSPPPPGFGASRSRAVRGGPVESDGVPRGDGADQS